MNYTDKAIERFWKKVDKKSSQVFYNGTRCWEWIAFRDSDGYGRIFMGENVLAHRVSYEINVGEIPEGFQVLHHCDNRRCVRPEHHFLGTQKDNIFDMDLKKRRGTTRGEMSGMAKLTEVDVAEIRRRYQRGVRGSSTTALAKEFRVTHRTISLIVRNKTWKINQDDVS